MTGLGGPWDSHPLAKLLTAVNVLKKVWLVPAPL